MNSWTVEMVRLMRSMSSSFSRAPNSDGRPSEGHFHQVGVDIDGADTGLSVEIPQRLREGVLHDRGQNVQLFSIEALLDETPLRAPGFPVGGEKAFAQEVAHPLH
jgi:hypothetical protein